MNHKKKNQLETWIPQLRLKHNDKKQNNIYAPGHYDITFKLCDFVNNLNNDVPSLQKVLLDKFAPYWQTLYGHLLHPCPYQVRLMAF
jgi:hypothetical protein